MSSSFHDRYFNINRTLIQKLVDTGYTVPDEELQAAENKQVFSDLFQSHDDLKGRVFECKYNAYDPVEKREIPKTKKAILWFFSIATDKAKTKTVSKESISEFLKVASAPQEGISIAFLVSDTSLSPEARNYLKSTKSVIRSVVFSEDELMFNPTQHIRVPKHTLLTQKEKAEWFASTGVKMEQMPRILLGDPQVKYLDGVVKDVIKVTNPSPTIGEYTRHLLVVPK